ncbi:hypothetical protein MKZ38_003377 [Zalerion maritima]|uniref:Myb-like domain-containing protein n=1 Tax=Zalerion maritima TaxID=339359 RepID=A0AAD5RP06_9PEZI|nr:hypothetical protein MKZ38_003377 [Zalerion maritima]
MTPHHPAHHHPQLLMDPMGGHPGARHLAHPGPATHYGGPGPPPHALTAPLYPTIAHAAGGPSHGQKRPRPDELDLNPISGMPGLEQSDLDQMQQTPMGSAYGPGPQQATHHHHRLPDQGPPSKMMRRDGDAAGGGGSGSGGAPNVVGQPGMPEPAIRPRGPKLKFTPEDDQLLIELKENKSLTWKQISDFFPGRSSGTLQVRYCTKLKAKTTQWTDETDQKLRTALQDYENEKWRIVANKVGTGFTPAACRERAKACEASHPTLRSWLRQTTEAKVAMQHTITHEFEDLLIPPPSYLCYTHICNIGPSARVLATRLTPWRTQIHLGHRGVPVWQPVFLGAVGRLHNTQRDDWTAPALSSSLVASGKAKGDRVQRKW